MRLIIGILFAVVFYVLLAKKIKKYPIAFYLGTYAWIGITIAYYLLKIRTLMPGWFTQYWMDIFQRGIFSTATFMIVMFLGTIIKPGEIGKRLLAIRGEMSIMGCIFILCHNVVYGVVYFPALFTKAHLMPMPHLIAAIISLLLLLLMIPLFVTSFKCVRKKMKPRAWKQLQRLAYPFFLLIYVHIMVLYIPSWQYHIIDIILYTLIFGAYIFLRLRKRLLYLRKSNSR